MQLSERPVFSNATALGLVGEFLLRRRQHRHLPECTRRVPVFHRRTAAEHHHMRPSRLYGILQRSPRRLLMHQITSCSSPTDDPAL